MARSSAIAAPDIIAKARGGSCLPRARRVGQLRLDPGLRRQARSARTIPQKHGLATPGANALAPILVIARVAPLVAMTFARQPYAGPKDPSG
jgi:hypothetical protein